MTETRKCKFCGVEFVAERKDKIFCSRNCCNKAQHAKVTPEQRKAWRKGKIRDMCAGQAIAEATPPTWSALTHAVTKPRGCSDVRWRIELRRRANPMRYFFTAP